jgi:hypothetical protein
MSIGRTFVALGLVLAFGSQAHATTILKTPGLTPAFTANAQLRCQVVNVGTTSINLKVEIINGNSGSVLTVNDCGTNFGPTQPGESCGDAVNTQFIGWCRITAGGSAKSIRGSLEARDSAGGGPQAAVSAY